MYKRQDLCLGLQAESILIERIPGKPTVGIEVPNSKREVIALRQMLESDEFAQAQSRLTISMGKDINGRIKVAALESMPHLLIAGSTGSGKSVMINSMVMSICLLYTSCTYYRAARVGRWKAIGLHFCDIGGYRYGFFRKPGRLAGLGRHGVVRIERKYLCARWI